jgi:DNA-binding beta-propeller fold protein YncE
VAVGGSILEFKPNGVRGTFAFLGLCSPTTGLAFDSAGNLFVSAYCGPGSDHGYILEFKPNGVRSIFASGFDYDFPEGLAFDSAGNLFVAVGGSILEFAPNGVRSTFASGLTYPESLAFDSAGNLFVADHCPYLLGGGIIYKFKPNGVRSIFASRCDLLNESFSFLAFQPTSSTPDTTSAPLCLPSPCCPREVVCR